MDLDVRLGGAILTWRFVGSPRLTAWCEERPWASAGAVLRATTSGVRQRRALAAVIDGIVRRADAGGTGVRTVTLEVADGASVAGAVAEHYELPPTVDRRTQVNAIARGLAYSPTVFVTIGAENDGPARLFSEGLALRDATAKVHSQAALAMIVLADQPSDDAIDLRMGAPIEAGHEQNLGGTRARWRRYLHRRLAWESAGNLDLALEWNDSLAIETLTVGDDEGLERALNAGARARLPTVPASILERVLAPGLDVRPGELQDAGVLWRPRSGAHLRPTPWLARAAVLGGLAQGRWPMLRGCVVAGSLLQEAMGRCFDLEHRVRDRYQPARTQHRSVGDAEHALAEFEAGVHFYEQFYPDGCPVRPRDVWDFTELGAVLLHVSASKRAMDAMHGLRKLRNALAHGHYVCWRTFQLLEELEATL